MSYRMNLARTSTDAAVLRVLTEWLTDGAAAVAVADSASTALQARMLYAAYATRLNHQVAMKPETCSCPLPTSQLFTLLENAVNAMTDKNQRALKERMARAAAALEENGTQPSSICTPDLSPTSAYSYACHWAQGSSPVDRQRALAFLDYAFADPKRKAFAAGDPSLSGLRDTHEYREKYGAEPPTTLWDLPFFAPHQKRLEAADLAAPELIALWRPRKLAHRIRQPMAVSRSLVRRAELISSVNVELEKHRLVIVSVLIDEGIDTVDQLMALRAEADPARRAAILDAVKEECVSQTYADPDLEVLDQWLVVGPSGPVDPSD